MRIRNVLQEYEAKLEALPAGPYPAARGEDVPVVELDQVLQVVHAGRVILEGRFYAE